MKRLMIVGSCLLLFGCSPPLSKTTVDPATVELRSTETKYVIEPTTVEQSEELIIIIEPKENK